MANTLAPLSEVAVANMAVTTLDDTALTSLDDPSAIGRFMAREYGFVRDELLRAFPWPFAKARVLLPALNEAPAFGYKYQYQLPADCLRVLPLRGEGEHNHLPIKFEVEGRKLLTDAGPALKLIYIRRVSNAAEFDPLFARALGQLLALMAAQRVTGKAAYFEKAQALYASALSVAYQVASLEGGTPESQNRSDIINVRGPYGATLH
jgi:hypothetical protein